MKDKWMNVGFEDDELKPYVEPKQNFNDPVRFQTLYRMGYSIEEIEDSLRNRKYDEVMVDHLLLGQPHIGALHGPNRLIQNAAHDLPQDSFAGNLTSSHKLNHNPSDRTSDLCSHQLKANNNMSLINDNDRQRSMANNNNISYSAHPTHDRLQRGASTAVKVGSIRKKSVLLMNSLIILIFISKVSASNIQTAAIFEPTCQPLHTPLCNITSYLTIQPFNNTFGHTDLNTALAELHKNTYLFLDEPCRSKIQLFLCSLYAPVCVTTTILDKILLPCRDDCEEAQQACRPAMNIVKTSWPPEWDCKKFNYHNDDKLCVINNTRDNHPITSTAPINVWTPDEVNSNKTHENETICTKDLFDCRLKWRNMNALCIDHSLVCDGKKDCVIDGVDEGGGLDELGCEKSCSDESLYCDGKVDCSSGIDEQNCYDYPTGLVQIVLLVVILYALYSLVRCCLPEPEKKVSEDFNFVEPTYDSEPAQDIARDSVPEPLETEPNPCYHNFLAQQRFPIYQELAYSIGTRSDYERVNVGGYSGASSVYGVYGAYHPPSLADEKILREPPAAPPPTPAPQSIYSTLPYDQTPYGV